jgi:hypothetical protein
LCTLLHLPIQSCLYPESTLHLYTFQA